MTQTQPEKVSYEGLTKVEMNNILRELASWWTIQAVMSESQIADPYYGIDQRSSVGTLVERYMRLFC